MQRAILSRRAILMVAAAAMMFSSCSSAGFKRVYTAQDSEGRIKTTVFPTKDSEIHILGELVSGRDDVVISLRLFVNGKEVDMLRQAKLAPGKGEHLIDYKLFVKTEEQATEEGGTSQVVESDRGPWPKGDYEAIFYIDGAKEETLSFKVVDG